MTVLTMTGVDMLCVGANYPVDILNCGPLIRYWCMTFEATIQVLKAFLEHCNFRDHLKRIAIMWGYYTALNLEEVLVCILIDACLLPTYTHLPALVNTCTPTFCSSGQALEVE